MADMGYNDQDLIFSCEKEATEFLLDRLRPHFQVISQVQMISIAHRDRPYRIDLVAQCRHNPSWVVGFEIKKGFTFMREYTAALRQAADYREAVIIDAERVPNLSEERPAAVVVFPNWNGLHTEAKREYRREAMGMEMLAEKFRVGVCGVTTGHHGLTFTLGWNRLWSAGAGWVKNGEDILFGKRHIGAIRDYGV